MEDPKQSTQIEVNKKKDLNNRVNSQAVSVCLADKLARKRSERFTYLVAAVMSSFRITSMAVMTVHYRFWWQMEGGEVPWFEIFGTFALSVGSALTDEVRWLPELI